MDRASLERLLKEQPEALIDLVLRQQELLEELVRQVELLSRQLFGQKTEQTPPGTLADVEAAKQEEEKPAPPEAGAEPKKKGGSKKGRKIRGALLPENLEVQRTVLEPPEYLADPDPTKWRCIGEEVSERLERIPGRYVRQLLARPKYVRVDEPYTAPVIAPAPKQLIEGGFLGLWLMVEIIANKYLNHLPLYRQAQMIERECGAQISLSTLCQTVKQVADAVEPVVKIMAEEMWRGGYAQMDLTPVRCLSREHKGGSFLGQMWVAGAPGGDVIFHWDKSKEALVAERIVPEWYRGALQCDGSTEIACFLLGGKERKRPPPDITRAGCWAHVRRKFFEAEKSGCRKSAKLLRVINLLYRIERIAREGNFDDNQRRELRQRRAARVIKGLKWRLGKVMATERPKSAVGQAANYALGQWAALQVYLKDGRVEIDNNGIENAIRPCALGRKNYLFIGEVGAGQRSALLYSLLGSCQRRGINPSAYLHWLLEKLPHATNQTVHTLTPAAYAQSQAPQAPPRPETA